MKKEKFDFISKHQTLTLRLENQNVFPRISVPLLSQLASCYWRWV
jgi:hypothetical protein